MSGCLPFCQPHVPQNPKTQLPPSIFTMYSGWLLIKGRRQITLLTSIVLKDKKDHKRKQLTDNKQNLTPTQAKPKTIIPQPTSPTGLQYPTKQTLYKNLPYLLNTEHIKSIKQCMLLFLLPSSNYLLFPSVS